MEDIGLGKQAREGACLCQLPAEEASAALESASGWSL